MHRARVECWFPTTLVQGGVLSVKIIRNKQTGFSEGYGFVEFANHQTAELALRAGLSQLDLYFN